MTQVAGPLWARRALLLPAAATMLLALGAGLERIGLAVGLDESGLVALHGPLMVSGLFGIVISLERAVAVGGKLALAAPALAVASVALLVAGAVPAAAASSLLSSLALVVLSAVVVKRQAALFTLAMLVGALGWLAGNLTWLVVGAPFAATWWWMAFLVVTIAGERLELSRLAPRPRHAPATFTLALGLVVVGAAAGELRLLGAGLAALALWLALYDVARRTVRLSGVARFSASALLSGFVWLALCGAVLVVAPPPPAGPRYDAAVHALGVGFVLSMVFAHAPIILPAVARVRLRFSTLLYLPLGVLHASLALRVAGDLLGAQGLRAAGAAGHVAAVLLYGAVTLWAARSK